MLGQKQTQSAQQPVAGSFNKRFVTTWDYLFHTKNGRLFLAALVVPVFIGIGLILYMLTNTSFPASSSTPFFSKPKPVYSPLTGKVIENEDIAKRPVTPVIIENNPESRPQSGLKHAGVVYEAVAEAGITRFLVLYQEDQPNLIGPVRSLRPYYVEWASAYDAGVAHVGGSARALKMIRSGKHGTDLDQFFNAGAYWRADDRAAPHNVYTNSSRLNSLLKAKNKKTSDYIGFERQDGQASSKPTAKKISIGISSGDYAVSYSYDAKNNKYTRKQGGSTHKDREKGTIAPDTVVAIKVPSKATFEDGHRESITTTGKGKAYIFQNGLVREGVWRKDSANKPLQLTDDEGAPIKLNRGQTWITALDTDRKVTWQ